ncbi:hypothetical protein COU53_03565 [Candidatus Pacearchaeota archaeon CG10_big_fil_rev_8_21_14_0_10_30_48]|nr:MAG: hypothetical protein COU53_03565 [Candidatus Pacearchaeota archaeon CG10_big_fil_rev_8_21_14_0_10_30_48]
MAKRIKRLEKGIESLKEEIEKHFLKLEKDIEEGNLEMGRYHFKELDKSLIFALERKLDVLDLNERIIEEYRNRLNKLKVRLK